MARPNKRRNADDRPEDWEPGRTFDSIKEMRLAADDLVEAARLLSVTDQRITELSNELQEIARVYWERRREWERPSADWYRQKVGRIERAAEKLLTLIREPQGTALFQLKVLTQRRMARRLLGGSGGHSSSIEELLNDFVNVCKSCHFNAAKGAPPKMHLKEAVAALRTTWIRFTNQEFPLNLEVAENLKERDGRVVAEPGPASRFTSPGPRFVQVVMQRIDSSASWTAIRSALRQACENSRIVK